MKPKPNTFTLADLTLLHELCIEARARIENSADGARLGARHAHIGGVMVDLKTMIDNGDYQ